MSIVNPVNVSTAEARRGDQVRRLRRQVDSLEGEIRRSNGGIGANGQRNEYLADRAEFLKGEQDRLQAEISRLSGLSKAELVEEFVPEAGEMAKAKDEPAPTLSDVLFARGPRLPGQEVRTKHPLPAHREGGEPGIPWTNAGTGVQSGVTYTYDSDGNLIRA